VISLILEALAQVAFNINTVNNMRKKGLLFISTLLFASFVPISCNKDSNIEYEFEGTITGSLSDAPISGVSVRISQKTINGGVSSNEFNLIGSASTDASGKFNIIFDREMVTEFQLSFRKDNYFNLNIIESSSNVSTAEVNIYNELLEPKSWITFDIENTFPNAGDHFKLFTQTFREGCQECAENKNMDFYGPLDTTFTYATTAGEYVKFTYINVTEGTSTTDSIYTVPFETIIYPIIY